MAVKQITSDKDTFPARGSTTLEHNKLVADLAYVALNRPAYQVAAAAVAPPVCARGTTASKVKTTATSQFIVNGVPKSITATDDLWTLSGANLAAGSVRRVLLLWDATTATTVVSISNSTDIVAAAFASNALALAACRFTTPPAGTVIVGILSIVNTTNAFIPGTTLLSATGVTDTYIDGFDDAIIQAAQVLP